MFEKQSRAYMPEAQSQEWQTPTQLFDALWEEFGGFTFDPCGQSEHHSVSRIVEHGGSFYDGSSLTTNGLSQRWQGKVYLNPPYGRVLTAWVKKAVNEVRLGNVELVVALLPARTDVTWWQECVIRKALRGGQNGVKAEMAANEVRFLPGRLRFVGGKHSAPFPSCIVVWRAKTEDDSSQPILQREEVAKMSEQQRQNGDGKSWAQWKRELSDSIEELDKACAKARQTIYQLRPLVRPKSERSQ